MLVELVKTDVTEIVYGYIGDGNMKGIGENFDAIKISEEMYKDEKGYMYASEDLKFISEEKDALQELERFQTDRLLHKNKFDLRIATMNILEELLEAHGVGDNKERLMASEIYSVICEYVEDVKEADDNEAFGYTYSEPTVEDQVDAFCDIQVFAGGEVMKLGYSNKQCLLEVGKEINSRTGEIVNGKFEKYKTEEAMAKWYKANFSGCKLCI